MVSNDFSELLFWFIDDETENDGCPDLFGGERFNFCGDGIIG